jgi:putative transposase
MQAALRQQGFVVNHKKLRRLMREHELLVIERLQGVINVAGSAPASLHPSSLGPPLAHMRLHCMAGVTQ